MGEVLKLKLSVPFASTREASIVYDVLRVDAEPKRGGVQKTLEVENTTLIVSFSASEARHLRVGINSFLEHLTLVTETIDSFGPPASDNYGFW